MRQDRLLEAVIIMSLLFASLLWARQAWSAEVVDSSRLADAISKAENSKAHPYGVMKDYCHAGAEAQCRKGCIQTINKWKSKLVYSDVVGFINQFGDIYAPTVGATNDPKGLNKNWKRNVLTFYKASL